MVTQLPDTPENTVIPEKVEFLVRIFVLAMGLMLLSRNIDTWFVGLREDNNALYSQFARNHIYYGFGGTKFFQTYGCAQTMPAKPERYLNHPPLLPVWVAMAMSVFGDHEWVGRSIPIATTLGSAWLLMIIIGRLQSPILGLLSGTFYLILPIIAYFGRILDHTSPVQFFSLLMLHGYLQWAGLYGSGYNRKAGTVYYVLGVLLGTGTDWGAVIMAGLIWLWHLWRVFHNHSSRRFLFWLTAIPAISLAAVIIHILYGGGYFSNLFLSRIIGVGLETPILWREWVSANASYLVGNFSKLGIGAAAVYPLIITGVIRYTKEDSVLRRIVRDGTSVIPILLTLMQGLIWIIALKQAETPEYWHYFLAPFFATAMASVILAIFALISGKIPRFAAGVTILLMFLPLPFFIGSTEVLYHYKWSSEDTVKLIVVFKKLDRFFPPRTAIMTSENYRSSSISPPQLDYYSNRPLIYCRDFGEIEANHQNCAGYLLEAADDPNTAQLAKKLMEKYKLVYAEQSYMIFLLNPHPADERMLPK